MATLSELFGTNNEAAKLMKEKIDELLGKKQVSGGVMNLLDTPANAVQDAHRERYLMDMFSGTNPDTGESFLEPAKTEYQTKLEEVYRNQASGKARMLETLANELGISEQEVLAIGSGARGFETPAQRDSYMDEVSRAMAEQDAYLKSLNIGARGLDTPAERNAIMNSMVGNNLGTSARDLGFTSARGFSTPATRDNAQAVLSRLSEAELADVMEILPQLNDVQYEAFIAGLQDGSINPSGYEVQNQYRLRM